MHNTVKRIYQGINQGTSIGPFRDGLHSTFSNLPLWFYLLTVFTIIFFLSMIMFLAPWLRGSKWINKKNPYIAGEAYIRTKAQRIVFRLTVIIIGLLFLSFFFIDMFLGDILGSNIGGWEVFEAIWEYIIGGGWYYQCFLSSLFIGIALISKKYNFMLIVWPMALLGALRTFGDITDVASEINSTSIQFWRFFFEHIMLIFIPLFVAISQRQRYTLKTIANSSFFTFMMVFVAYVGHSFILLSDPTITSLADWGEIEGLAKWFGHSDIWLVNHLSFFFWLIAVPFGIGVAVPIIFLYRFFETKSRTEGSFGRRWINVWRLMWEDLKVESKEYKNSKWVTFFTRGGGQIKRVKEVPFGTDPDWFYRKEKEIEIIDVKETIKEDIKNKTKDKVVKKKNVKK